MYKPLLLLLPACIFLLTLLPFLNPGNLWKTDTYLHRKARVEKVCQDFRDQIERDDEARAQIDHHLDPEGDPLFPYVHVSRKERFFWCEVPKAASTSWKTYFLKQSGLGGASMEKLKPGQINYKFWKTNKNIFLWYSDAREKVAMDGFDSFITVTRVAKCQIFSQRKH